MRAFVLFLIDLNAGAQKQDQVSRLDIKANEEMNADDAYLVG